jgi:hypothetical protein
MRLIKNLLKRILRGMSDQKLTAFSELFFTLNNKIDDQIRWVVANRERDFIKWRPEASISVKC